MDLLETIIDKEELAKLQLEGVLPSRRVLGFSKGGADPLTNLGEIITLTSFVYCGFLLFSSEFLVLLLDFYGLNLLHLILKSIFFLSIFSHLYEAYLGVQPFLDLFRYFYEVRFMESSKISGCYGLRLRDGMWDEYILFNCPSSRKFWRLKWFFLTVDKTST